MATAGLSYEEYIEWCKKFRNQWKKKGDK